MVAVKKRHDYVVERLNSIPGVDCLKTDGTFYCFPNIEGALAGIDGVNNDLELAEYLIEHAGVALVPGTAFGLHGHVRLSIATSMDNLVKALDRLEKVLAG